MGDIVTTGIPADYALPGNFIEVNLGAGPVSGSALDYPILLIGNKTSAGDATVDTAVYGPTSALPLVTEADWIARFGTGSELHRMFLRVADARLGAGNQTTAIYAIAVTESAGVAASQAITFTNAATGPGTVRVYVAGEYVEAAISTGDSVTTIATAARDAINAKTSWPVTATYDGNDLADPPAQGAHVPGPQVATKDTIRGSLIRLIKDFDENDQLKNVATIIANTVVHRASLNSNRAQSRVPLEVIDILDQTTTNIDQVG